MAAGKLDLAKDLKFGTLNALQDTNVNNSGDRRRTSSLSSLNASTAKAYSRDTLRGSQRFNGIIVHKRLITSPRYSDRMSLLQSYVATAPDTVAPGDAGSGNPLPYQNAGRTAYKVYIPELEPRPAPNSATDPILKTYPDVFAAPGREELENLPLGAVVEVSYEDPERLYNPKIVDGNKEQYVLLANYEKEQTDLKLMFGNGHKGLMGDSAASAIGDLLDGVPQAAAGQVIESSAPPNPGTLRAAVNAEIQHWNGKKENDTEVAPRLEAYWSNLGMNVGPDIPWSAAFISYVMNQVDTGFPKSSAHYYYAASAKQKKGGWSLFQTSGGGKIKAQVGDILVKPRAGSAATSTHGDVVYKIEPGTPGAENTAILAGGNVGDTIKSTIALAVDTSGYYKNFGDYIVVLKKAGKVVSADRSV